MPRAHIKYAKRPAPPRKEPEIPLDEAVRIAARAIDRANGDRVGVFMASGIIKTARIGTPTFEVFMHRTPGGFVGVYDDYGLNENALHGALREDIAIFYQGAAQ